MLNKFNKQKRASVAEVLNECLVDRSVVHGIPTWRNLSTDAACNKNIKTKYSNLLPDGTVEGTCFDGSALPDIETTKSLLSKLCEVMIRFDANPKFYLKGDFAKLIELLNGALIHLYTHELKVDTNDKILDVDDENNIFSTLSLVYDSENETVCLLGKDGDVISHIDVDDLINKKQDKDSTAVANNVAVFNAEGNTVDSKTKIGGSVLSDNPDKNTLATELAVLKAIDDIEIQVAENDPLLKVDNLKKLFSTINLKHDSDNHELQLLGQNNAILAKVSTLDFIKDSVLDTASFGFYTKEADKYEPSTSTDPDALPYVVLTFNTDAGKTPIYLSFNDLVSYTIDALLDDLEEINSELLNKQSKDTDATENNVAVFNAGSTVDSGKKIGGEEFGEREQTPVVEVIGRGNYGSEAGKVYGYCVPNNNDDLIYITNAIVYEDKDCTIAIGRIYASAPYTLQYLNVKGDLNSGFSYTPAGDVESGNTPVHYLYGERIIDANTIATELGVENYITSYISTDEDINNILNIIP